MSYKAICDNCDTVVDIRPDEGEVTASMLGISSSTMVIPSTYHVDSGDDQPWHPPTIELLFTFDRWQCAVEYFVSGKGQAYIDSEIETQKREYVEMGYTLMDCPHVEHEKRERAEAGLPE